MIGIVDYGVGNLHSVRNAIEMLGGEAKLVRTPEELRQSERVILPGVGAFGECIRSLKATGIVEALKHEVFKSGKPLFGICVGMQLMARLSFEHGTHEGLGWLPANVKKFDQSIPGVKVPHVGWNEVNFNRTSPLFAGLRNRPTFYFVHSYHLVTDDFGLECGSCDYGYPFTAAVLKDNVFATQFHPEKSQQNGLKLLENFLRWKP